MIIGVCLVIFWYMKDVYDCIRIIIVMYILYEKFLFYWMIIMIDSLYDKDIFGNLIEDYDKKR